MDGGADELMIQRKQVSNSVTVVQFDHGRVSALDLEFLLALRAELAELSETDAALVLIGTGSAFSAGVDLFRILDGGAIYLAQFIPGPSPRPSTWPPSRRPRSSTPSARCGTGTGPRWSRPAVSATSRCSRSGSRRPRCPPFPTTCRKPSGSNGARPVHAPLAVRPLG